MPDPMPWGSDHKNVFPVEALLWRAVDPFAFTLIYKHGLLKMRHKWIFLPIFRAQIKYFSLAAASTIWFLLWLFWFLLFLLSCVILGKPGVTGKRGGIPPTYLEPPECLACHSSSSPQLQLSWWTNRHISWGRLLPPERAAGAWDGSCFSSTTVGLRKGEEGLKPRSTDWR